MRALCWHGKKDIRCDNVPDQVIEHPRDAIVKVISCAICGSDLHLYDGFMPGMENGDIMGHEFMGEVVEVGSENQKLSVGDRVVVPFTICCGECEQCRRGYFSVCERANRINAVADKSLRPHHGRPVRLTPTSRVAIPGAGRVCAGALRRTGPTHVNRWTDDLLRRIQEGQIDPAFVITHRVGLQEGPPMYENLPRQARRLRQGRSQAVNGVAHA
jgi:threonine dehydrogenase-like Zn-dependent dehydrogenase